MIETDRLQLCVYSNLFVLTTTRQTYLRIQITVRAEFLCISVFGVASGPRVRLVGCGSALNPRWFTLLTVLRRWPQCWSYFLLLCGLFCGAICFVFYLVSFSSLFFSPSSIAITSLGEERANLSAFRTFVRFVLLWICRFPLHLGVWKGLRFVIVALPELFSYHFLHSKL